MESMEVKMNLDFYKNKRVLITGHTGFKGTWLSKILLNSGAILAGYSLTPKTKPNIFSLAEIDNEIVHRIGDIRNYEELSYLFNEFHPEIVFHLAAQPIVRDSYKDPVYTYETNVLGTVNVLECVRNCDSVRSVLNVTTDKVYLNREWCWGYRENEKLDGFDPYSNSKSCSELVTHSYMRSFLSGRGIAVSTARAGNVIGGGDFANDRIIPDCIRSMQNGKTIVVRNPNSIRPYQHVLEPLSAYLLIALRQYERLEFSGSYNVGPDEQDCITTGNLVDLFCEYWGAGAKWKNVSENNSPHEADFLKLDCSKIKSVLGWKPKWHIDECMKHTVEFYRTWVDGGEISKEINKEIDEYFT